MKIMALFAILASLFGCGKNDPYILDGPGMMYIDSEYRTEYANCLPFNEYKGSPYLAIAYLGNGDAGKANKGVYIEKIFENLDDEKISEIKTFEYEGDDWFLVVPRYRDLVSLKKGNEELSKAVYNGEAFVVRCNQDIVVNTFNVNDINYLLSVNEDGTLKSIDENVWDITKIDEIMVK